MPGRDPTHWLHRLDPDEWLEAAETELRRAAETLARRAQRPGVAHARRAAGMALNAILVLQEIPTWGRSYMDHVIALGDDATAPDPVRAAARRLAETSPAPPTLVQIGKPDLAPHDSARAIAAWARTRVAALRGPA